MNSEMDHPQQPHTFFSENPNSGLQEDQRKRGGDPSSPCSSNAAASETMPTPQLNISPTSNSSNAAPFQMMPTPQYWKKSIFQQTQHTAEIEQYWNSQTENLRSTLEQKRMYDHDVLLMAAKGWAMKKIGERDAEIKETAMKTTELETMVTLIHKENLRWQAKALSDKEKIASLQATLCQGGSDAEDPGRAKVGISGRPCRVCGRSEVSVVIVPCRHLCLCKACEADLANKETVCCPVCNAVRIGGIEVFYS